LTLLVTTFNFNAKKTTSKYGKSRKNKTKKTNYPVKIFLMTAIITQIFQKLKDSQETIKRLKRKSKKHQKLLFDLEDSLAHQEEFLRVLQTYTQKLVQRHQID